MRTIRWIPLLVLLTGAPALAAEPACPLDVATCLSKYQRTKERPWLGVRFDQDSTGHYEAIPENVFARMIGTHMLEGHLAHMPKSEAAQH